MALTPQPQFRVERLDPRARRKRAILATALILIALAAGMAAGIWIERRSAPTPGTESITVAPSGGSTVVRAQAQKIATLQRSEQVAHIAARDLRRSLAEREEEISGLRADLAFYANLVGSGERDGALAVHGVHVQPIAGSRAWNVTVTLTQHARRGKENKGTVKLAVEGVRNGKLELLHWKQITTPDTSDGLSYAFRYFQQLHATLMLPENFSPNRLRILVHPANGEDAMHSMAWTDTLESAETDNVQKQEPAAGS